MHYFLQTLERHIAVVVTFHKQQIMSRSGSLLPVQSDVERSFIMSDSVVVPVLARATKHFYCDKTTHPSRTATVS